jgi:hypothetical protein
VWPAADSPAAGSVAAEWRSLSAASPEPGGCDEVVVVVMQRFLRDLPAGSARLQTGIVNWNGSYRSFAITPANPHAAQFSGAAVGDTLYLTVGEAACLEIRASGGSLIPGAALEEELRALWRAIVAGGFKEELCYNRAGKLIHSRARMRIAGKTVTLGYRPPFPRIEFPGGRRIDIQYQPYI